MIQGNPFSDQSKWRSWPQHLGQSSTCLGTMKYMRQLLHSATTKTWSLWSFFVSITVETHHHSHSRNRLLFSKPDLLPLSPTSEFSLPPQTQPESTTPSRRCRYNELIMPYAVEMRERSGAEMRDREQVQIRETKRVLRWER